MKIVVNVTQDHIDRGRPDNRCECPIALALLDAGHAEPDVSPQGIAAKGWECLNVPLAAVDFIEEFDERTPHIDDACMDRKHVDPFTFTLRARKVPATKGPTDAR